MKKLIVLTVASVVLPQQAIANDCAEVIKLSLTTSRVVQSQEQFETDAREFCSAYSRNSQSSSGGGGSIGYGGFSFGATSSSGNAKTVARNVCENTSSGRMRDDAYSRLIQNIAPQAYSSYDSCINEKRSVNVTIGAGTTPAFVPITIGFVPQTEGEFAEIAVVTDDTVACDLSEPRRMTSAGNFIIACRRRDVTRMGSINVINQAGGSGALSVPWTAYTAPDGIPVNLAQQYIDGVAKFEAREAALKGSVVAYEASSCPVGYQPYEKAFGRFVRGLDLRGELDPDRTVGDLQDDELAAHVHTEQRARMSGDRAGTGRDNFNAVERQAHQTVQSGSTGGAETRPKNVALLYCQAT